MFDPLEVVRTLDQYYVSIYKNQYDHGKHRDHYLEAILVAVDNLKHAIDQRDKIMGNN